MSKKPKVKSPKPEIFRDHIEVHSVEMDPTFKQLAQMAIEDLFTIFDSKGDGCIASTQLGDLARVMGYHPTQEEVAKVSTEFKDKKGARVTKEKALPIIDAIRRDAKDVEPQVISDCLLHYIQDGKRTMQQGAFSRLLTNLGDKLSNNDANYLFEAYYSCVPGDSSEEVDVPKFCAYVVSQGSKYTDEMRQPGS